jgi:hypothetical protein
MNALTDKLFVDWDRTKKPNIAQKTKKTQKNCRYIYLRKMYLII